jgi:hypothetical protein
MKKGDYVQVTNKANYVGQNMAWTEQVTGQVTLKKGDVLYHFSSKKLTSFFPKTTCFFMTDVKTSGYCYILRLLKDITVDCYMNEIRLNLYEGKKLQYLGEVKKIRTDEKIFLGHRHGWVPKYKIIDNRI